MLQLRAKPPDSQTRTIFEVPGLVRRQTWVMLFWVQKGPVSRSLFVIACPTGFRRSRQARILKVRRPARLSLDKPVPL